MTTLIGYARVSTDDQKATMQQDALKAAGCLKVFTDKASGSLAHRPQLDRMLDQLRPGDVVVVWRLDRLGRSLKNLIALVEDLAERGVGFRSLSESIDTTTANGKLVLLHHGCPGGVREGSDPGAHDGWTGGCQGTGSSRWPSPDDDARQDQGGQADVRRREHTVEAIAKTLGVSRKTIYRHLKPEVA